jgi:uncharacterized protein (DUF2249 family)
MSLAVETNNIDVRLIAPPDRHAAVSAAFLSLAPGGSFNLLSDHEPRPLHSQFLQQWPGQFGWDVLEAGPSQWHIRINREAAAKGCCGCCGG